jgi:DNA-binding NtrC family response regulator
MAAPSHLRPRFDRSAVTEIEHLIAADDLLRAQQLLATHAPSGPLEHIEFERLSARILSLMGEYPDARRHAIRALRLTRAAPAGRAHVRCLLAAILSRSGSGSSAEKQLNRALVEVRSGLCERKAAPQILNELAMIYRRRGLLTVALRLYEQAVSQGETLGCSQTLVAAFRRNLCLCLIHRGETAAAGALLRRLIPRLRHIADVNERALLHLTQALYSLHVNELSDCASALALAGELSSGIGLRTRTILREYRADLLTARGRASDAVSDLVELLEEVRQKAPFGDLVPEVSRRLASALLACGRPRLALEKAELAISTGRHADKLEWAAGLRVAGQCHATLGDRDEAQRAFSEALAVLQTTEFNAERQRLDEAILALPAQHHLRTSNAWTEPVTANEQAAERLALKDGRLFRTHDRVLVDAIRLAAGDRLPVLIEGETGTGKELVARLLHESGSSAGGPFVVVDCTTLPEGLAESELFGAARGAFSGAVIERAGLIAAAEGGTLFFDELPELSIAVQGKLLRLLQDGTYRRVGEARERRVSARFLAATNQSARQLVAAGKLRGDLFYRLKGHRLCIDPLRRRSADLELLAIEFARAGGLTGISADTLGQLRAHTWPGNVRELEMLIRVASRHAKGSMLDVHALLLSGFELGTARDAGGDSPLRAARSRIEHDTLEEGLKRCGGNLAATARAMRMSRQGLQKALQRAGLP